MFYKKRVIPCKRRHNVIMDNCHPTSPRNKLWFVFFVLFFFWYMLLYGFDWASLPGVGLTYMSRQQDRTLQFSTASSNPVSKPSDNVSNDKNQQNPIQNPKSGDVLNDKNQANTIQNTTSDDVSNAKNHENTIQNPKSDHGSNAKNQENTIQNPKSDHVSHDKNVTTVSDVKYELKNVSRTKPTVDDHVENNEAPEVNLGVKNENKKKNKKRKKGLEEPEKRDKRSAFLQNQEEKRDNGVTKGKKTRTPCTGRYIYIQELPSQFNTDYVENCLRLSKWVNMCPYLVNEGLGQRLKNLKLFLPTGWYVTHQFSLEVIFHNRIKQYDCLTNNSSQAAAIYVPYYAGLDVSRFLFDRYKISTRDTDSLELLELLRQKPEWGVMGGRDHFSVAGRITWDFRRTADDDAEWGNKLMLLPESKNMTILIIESSPWHKNDFAIPYPTYFHPSNDGEVYQWQSKMRQQKRRHLFCFTGGPRPNMTASIRGEIMAQCARSRGKCVMMECVDRKRNCLKPEQVMRMFESSNFCLQPSGDSYTRRSTFDSIVAGCIPVFFTPASAYVQYLWHLPRNFGSYSVLIPENDVRDKKVDIERVLARIPKAKVAAMREEVIKLIPNVIYAHPRSRLENFEDAFDLAIKGVVERVEGLRRELREGRNSSVEFDPEFSWKYYTFGTTEKHEWDPYFKH